MLLNFMKATALAMGRWLRLTSGVNFWLRARWPCFLGAAGGFVLPWLSWWLQLWLCPPLKCDPPQNAPPPPSSARGALITVTVTVT